MDMYVVIITLSSEFNLKPALYILPADKVIAKISDALYANPVSIKVTRLEDSAQLIIDHTITQTRGD